MKSLATNNQRPAKQPGAKFTRRSFVKNGLGLMAAPLLWHCNKFIEGAEESNLGDPRLTARPGAPTETPESGLNELGLSSGRDGLLYVPASYSPNTPPPLFIGLHGAGGGASNWASYQARAEERGFVFLAPNSRASTWDITRGAFGPDVKFIDDALKHVFNRCNIDPKKIALGGFSDGASYALSLGLSNGDLFSHLIAYSPGFFQTPEFVGTPLVYVSHGTGDNILPVESSRDTIVPTLNSNDYDVTYNEFEGGHEVPAEISEEALDWFFEQE